MCRLTLRIYQTPSLIFEGGEDLTKLQLIQETIKKLQKESGIEKNKENLIN